MEIFEAASSLDKVALKKLLIASTICLVFMIGEIIGGLLANSLAIATDAAHLLTDLSSFIISMASIWLAAKPASSRLNWGWHRAEVLGALTSLIFIWIVTGILVYMAILRVINQDYEIDAVVMLITAAVGLFFNIIMGFVLHSSGHTHSGSHSHNSHDLNHYHASHASNHHSHQEGDDVALLIPESTSTIKKVSKTNINVRAAFIHVIGDILQSIGVLIAAYIIYYKPTYKIADPICTFVFSLLVIFTTCPILKDTVLVLMEASPQGFNRTSLHNEIASVVGVKSIKALRVWSLTVGRVAGTVNIAIDAETSDHAVIISNIRQIFQKYDVMHSTVQIDF